MPSGWRSNFYQHQSETYISEEVEYKVEYRVEGDQFTFINQENNYDVRLRSVEGDKIKLQIDGVLYSFTIVQRELSSYLHNEQYGQIHLIKKERFPIKEQEKIKGGYEAPMPSQVISLLVKSGQQVSAGEGLIVLSSMKMENTIEAVEDGVVEEIYVSEGSSVEAGFLLLKIG